MANFLQLKAALVLVLALCLESLSQAAVAHDDDKSKALKSAVFLSPKLVMTPGSVINRFYRDIDFPRGHVGIKSFDAEVVDEAGVPIPLHETYLHHWVLVRYYQSRSNSSDYRPARNSGVCQNLGQYFGLGSETRRTSTHVPHPYAIEVGKPDEIPDGYEEKWMLNVHAIDTRGVVDKLGCTECRCHLYNVTKDEYGRPLKPGYDGGLYCCYDQTQCRLRPGIDIASLTASRGLYLRYTVKWVDWERKSLLLPVQIYIFDVTDTFTADIDPSGGKHRCLIEYEVEPCKSSGLAVADNICVHSKKTSFSMPKGGYVVYGVAHQHSGGMGSTLYGEDGRPICSSIPIYGKGEEAGNEKGYIVGMSTCYPQPGSVKIMKGETLVLVSNYSSSQKHTGVMGLFYILVADQIRETVGANSESNSHPLFVQLQHLQVHQKMNMQFAGWAIFTVGMVILAVAAVLHYKRSRKDKDGYSPIMA